MNLEKLTSAEVLRIATEQIKNNGSTTTLDVKRQLRTEAKFEAFQWEVSKFMQDLFAAGSLASTNDSSLPYQTYDLPQGPAAPIPAVNVNTTNLSQKAHPATALSPVATSIVARLSKQDKITRSEIIGLGYSGGQADSALQLLMKKNMILRSGVGEYEAVVKATAISTAPSLDKDKKIADLEQLLKEKDEKIQVIEKKLSTSAKLIEAAHSELIIN